MVESVGSGESGLAGAEDSANEGDSGWRGGSVVERVWVWGVPFVPWTMDETITAIDELIAKRRPAFFVTANVNYAMLTDAIPDLASINSKADFIIADGAPLVWASRLGGRPLPERVAGSDLIFRLSEHAALKGHRMFFLGGANGVAEEAARRLMTRYSGLQIVGVECPPFRERTVEEETALVGRIRDARPDILLVAFGQPKGERWIVKHMEELNVPVSVQVGASLDFAAQRVSRAPRWMQKTGLEWAFRMAIEPRRMVGRYARNAWFIARMVGRSMLPSRRSIGRD